MEAVTSPAFKATANATQIRVVALLLRVNRALALFLSIV
jgi:hypothetical protein